MHEWLKASEFWSNLLPTITRYYPYFVRAIGETLQMVLVSGLISALFGVILGVILMVTSPGGILENKVIYMVLDKLVNLFRAIPFIILIVVLIPVTRSMVGTYLGVKGAILPLVVGTVPFFSRQIHSALVEVDSGVVEAAQSMGASPFEIIFRVYLREGLPGMIRGATITLISLVGLTAMAGNVGAGGLGDFAIKYGFQQYKPDAMALTVIVLLVIVTVIQSIGNLVANKLKR